VSASFAKCFNWTKHFRCNTASQQGAIGTRRDGGWRRQHVLPSEVDGKCFFFFFFFYLARSRIGNYVCVVDGEREYWLAGWLAGWQLRVCPLRIGLKFFLYRLRRRYGSFFFGLLLFESRKSVPMRTRLYYVIIRVVRKMRLALTFPCSADCARAGITATAWSSPPTRPKNSTIATWSGCVPSARL
jgi:hypothetical protein